MIELLVAASITVILAGLMLTVVVNALNSWNRSHGSLQAEAQARLVLDQLASDLQGAMYRSDGNVWLAANVLPNTTASGLWVGGSKPGNDAGSLDLSASQNNQNPVGLLTGTRFGVAGVWLRLITSAASITRTASEPSAPVAVSYQLIRRLPNDTSGDPHYLLYRSETAPSATFSGGYNLAATTLPVAPYVSTLSHPDTLSAIADNVVDFGLRLYVRENGALRLIFPAKPAGVGAVPVVGTLSDGTVAAELEHLAYGVTPVAADYYGHSFPDVADVMIRVLTADGAKLIDAYESNPLNFPGQDWWTIVTKNSKVFTRRIVMNPSPL